MIRPNCSYQVNQESRRRKAASGFNQKPSESRTRNRPLPARTQSTSRHRWQSATSVTRSCNGWSNPKRFDNECWIGKGALLRFARGVHGCRGDLRGLGRGQPAVLPVDRKAQTVPIAAQERATILLMAYEGWASSRIACYLGISVHTVRRVLSMRALELDLARQPRGRRPRLVVCDNTPSAVVEGWTS
jgi:hypothetical protein